MPRVTKTSGDKDIIGKSLFTTSFTKKPNIVDKNNRKYINRGLADHLSTTVATTGHNTGLGWNESIRGSTKQS